jgi:hypothetical protein
MGRTAVLFLSVAVILVSGAASAWADTLDTFAELIWDGFRMARFLGFMIAGTALLRIFCSHIFGEQIEKGQYMTWFLVIVFVLMAEVLIRTIYGVLGFSL